MLNRKSYVDPNKVKDIKETISKGDKVGNGVNTKGANVSAKTGVFEGAASFVSQTVSKLDIFVRGIEAGTKLVDVAIKGMNEYRKCTNERIRLGLEHDQKMYAQAEETRRKLAEYDYELKKIIENNNLEINKLVATTYDKKLKHEEIMKRLNLDEKKLDAMIAQYEEYTIPMIKVLEVLVDNMQNEYKRYNNVNSDLFQKILAVHNQLTQSHVVVMQINGINSIGFDEVRSIE